ncbi:cell wall metabolism sensor histidine kinase WalK [Paenibacillus sp. FSL H7-0331]|uniref:sensor histidine kinase n=1 Tax=Paenibacillus sp. FSL H7-0331 TaxID=1920421 RepID=UPI00096F6145|nr:HAMP domain-containing sensor histidine kinase [Paenibacillus sp. FSL H7-0331]OMF07118.1 two-component sensor histidine kinase [Paenibacillus sp. FSL H7-0331]
MKKERLRHFAKGVLGTLVALLTEVSCCALAYAITSWFYAYRGIEVPDLISQLINVALGSMFAISIILIIGFTTRPKQMHFIHVVMEAMRQISQGNFNVSLDKTSRHQGHFEVFVDSINHMAQQLKHMEAMRQEFISNVSHEIQSPLTSINGFAQALQQDHLSEDARRHYLHIIETESRRLSRLSDNLLKLTSLESEHYPYNPGRYRLDKQLRNLVLACEPQWLSKKIDMDVSLVDMEIVADEELLSQVWVNLLYNSIKFTPDGGTITVRLEKEQDQVLVSISDTGIGIAEEDQTRIFERFFKADVSRNRSVSGSGLGLSIVHRIIEMHQGAITVESKLGTGTTITVKLPETAEQPQPQSPE